MFVFTFVSFYFSPLRTGLTLDPLYWETKSGDLNVGGDKNPGREQMNAELGMAFLVRISVSRLPFVHERH